MFSDHIPFNGAVIPDDLVGRLLMESVQGDEESVFLWTKGNRYAHRGCPGREGTFPDGLCKLELSTIIREVEGFGHHILEDVEVFGFIGAYGPRVVTDLMVSKQQKATCYSPHLGRSPPFLCSKTASLG